MLQNAKVLLAVQATAEARTAAGQSALVGGLKVGAERASRRYQGASKYCSWCQSTKIHGIDVDVALRGRYSERIYGKRLVLIANPAMVQHAAHAVLPDLPATQQSLFDDQPPANSPVLSATFSPAIGGNFTA